MALAFLTLAGLVLSVYASSTFYGTSEASLGRATAAEELIGEMDGSSLIRASFPPSVSVGNTTCRIGESPVGLVVVKWSFWTTAGMVTVMVSCGAP